ncbi:MAG: SAVED domain-containing protein, partial [Candidatus Heimdallarchaeota archaeon]|nr:SAVED domain-containing protein [Candidatus Heimdallarchaeota archaeon]MCK4609690.1 SAVED domain-containing protein [Candidatus Heimdallarchaeota archaeon]
MISARIIRDKISLLNIEQSAFTEKDIKHIRNSRKEFSRSLFLLSNLEEINLNSLNEIDKLIVLFKEIVGAELLVRFNEKGSIRDQFTKRIAILLATRKEQLEIIRNHLDVLYRLRNEIAHTLSISKGEEFEIYFKNDLETAIYYANSYHKSLLIRLFFKETEVIDKTTLLLKLKKFDRSTSISKIDKLDVPLPEYNLILSKELSEITGIESSYSKQAFSFKLPEEKKKYYLGLNSHGGLITPVHFSVDKFEHFYEDTKTFTGDSRIIPSTDVWNDFISSIKNKINEIKVLEPERLRIVSKTHKSVLFFAGYHLSKTKKIIVVSDIDGKEIDLKPLKTNVDFKQYWNIQTKDLNNKDTEAVLILNITGHIDQIVQNDFMRLNISNLPR